MSDGIGTTESKKDFVPIARVGDYPFCIVVQASSPINSMSDLLTAAKAKPGALRYSTGGNGGVGHLAGELFKNMAKLDIDHIPYKGLAQASAGLMGGQVDMTMADLATTLPRVKAGGPLKALGVTSAERVKWLPNVPTVSESGFPGYEVVLWNGLFLPHGTQKQIVDVVHAAMVSIFKTPDKKLTDRYDALGVILPLIETREAFAVFVKADLAFWKKTVEISGAAVD